MLRIAILLAAVLASSAVARAADAPPSYSQVHAVFAKHCLACHDAKEAEGGYVMDALASVLKGGDTGPAIVPGKSADSLLVKLIEQKKEPYMPPPKKAAKLSDAEIALVSAWIDAGAKADGPGDAPVTSASRPATLPTIATTVAPRQPVQAVAFSGKANLMAVALPGVVEIRPADGSGVVRRFGGHAGAVNAVAFSADGAVLAAAGGDVGTGGQVKLWDVAAGTLVRTIAGHKDAIYSLAISPDGRTLATGSYDQDAALWDVGTGNHLRDLKGHNGAVLGLSFRNDGKVLASAGADRTIKLWDVASGKRLDTRSEPTKEQNAVAFSPDGTRLAAAGVDNRVRVWKVSPTAAENTNPLVLSQFAHEGAILRLAWAADGRTVVTSADDLTVKVWDLSPDGKELTQKALLPKQSDWPTGLALGAADKTVVVGRLDGSLGVYTAADGKLAPPAKPELSAVEPRGVQAGRSVTLKLSGKNLAKLTAVRPADTKKGEGLTLRLAPPAADAVGDEFTAARVEVTVGEKVRRGTYGLIATGPGGDSAAVNLYVDDVPQVDAQPRVDTPAAAQSVATPADVWGAFTARGDAHHFAFDAKAGRTVVLDAAARSMGSKAAIVLTVLDAAGKSLASADRYDLDPDALLAFDPPADGRYVVRVANRGSGAMAADLFYRLSITDSPFVTGAMPLAVPMGKTSTVRLAGYNLPPDASVTVSAGAAGSETPVPLDPAMRRRKPVSVVASTASESAEVEPNDKPEQAVATHVAPFGISGTLSAPKAGVPDVDLFRFTAAKGKAYVIETVARRRGSPADTKIEVLHPDGKPVDRVKLRAVRDSNVTFRPFDANAAGGRFVNWEEMDLDQYMYLSGEVVRLFRAPQGPDSEYVFYPGSGGRRRGYFDTGSAAHALDEKTYIVEPHAPTDPPAPSNGLPTFSIPYVNDDASLRDADADSRLTFAAPADGDYLIRVTDVRGFGGDRFVYRLAVRESVPDFSVSTDLVNAAVPAGGGRNFAVRVNRVDGFEGPVKVDIKGVPPGFVVSTPMRIEASQGEAIGTIFQTGGPATMPAMAGEPFRAEISAMVDGKPVGKPAIDLGKPIVGGKSPVRVWLLPDDPATAAKAAPASAPANRPAEIVVPAGGFVAAWLKVDRDGFKGPLSFDVENLPRGVIVSDIGLNGVLINDGESVRQIFIQAAPWVFGEARPAHSRAREVGGPTSTPVWVRVAPPSR